ncbi:MAG: protein-glutamate O-methyltransferase CheR [Gammaproteobacteria bacterium]|nr:MAG: protein-glutamate O-methyltransferase CheR [Gammaproteobacteria bacterium]
MPLQRIDPKHYQAFQALLEEFCGIVLGPNKQYLVSSRLNKLMREYGLGSLGELVDRLNQPGNVELRGKVVDQMTTNETQWFRDEYPFSVLKNTIFPQFMDSGTRNVKIWSAACSTGQEPYSISMAIDEFRSSVSGGALFDGTIIGTDISPTVLEQAKNGIYQSSAISRGLSPERRNRFFERNGDGSWCVSKDIKSRVSFKNFNLLESYSLLGRFDIIFCRNVLIYFSSDLRAQIIGGMTRILNKGGYLVLGSSESLGIHSKSYEFVKYNAGVIYKLKDD